eukprot:166139_1
MSRELIFQSKKPILNETALKLSLADHVDPVSIVKIKINKSKKKAYVTLNNTQYNQVLSNADAFYIEDEAISISPTTVTTNELYDEIQSLKQLVLTMKEQQQSLDKKIQTCTDFLKKNQTRDAWDREYEDPPFGDYTIGDSARIDGGVQGFKNWYFESCKTNKDMEQYWDVLYKEHGFYRLDTFARIHREVPYNRPDEAKHCIDLIRTFIPQPDLSDHGKQLYFMSRSAEQFLLDKLEQEKYCFNTTKPYRNPRSPPRPYRNPPHAREVAQPCLVLPPNYPSNPQYNALPPNYPSNPQYNALPSNYPSNQQFNASIHQRYNQQPQSQTPKQTYTNEQHGQTQQTDRYRSQELGSNDEKSKTMDEQQIIMNEFKTMMNNMTQDLSKNMNEIVDKLLHDEA